MKAYWYKTRCKPSRFFFVGTLFALLCLTMHRFGRDDVRDDVRDDNEERETPKSIEDGTTFVLPTVEEKPDWKKVEHSNNQMYVYSAFYDARKHPPCVRIIAIIKSDFKVHECVICTRNSKIISSPVRVEKVSEHWSLPYCSAQVVCEGFVLPDGDTITEVEINAHNNDLRTFSSPKTSTLNVIDIQKQKLEGRYSVCVKPLHYEFNRAVWLVEFIELYRILGVQKFFFYNHTVGKDVGKVLTYYIKKSIVELLPWSLPVKSQKEIRTEAIFASLNDCNLRNIGRYNFSLMIDIDEFILPQNVINYDQLIGHLGNYDSYIFQNVFFYLYWENDTTFSKHYYKGPRSSLGSQLFGSESEGPYLLTAYKTTRVSKPHNHGLRSKYIVRPEKAIEVGNHVVWRYTGAHTNLNVDSKDAIVHHYRICEFGGFDCLKHKNKIDRSAHKWLPVLMNSAKIICSEIFTETKKCPEAPPLGSP